MIQKHGFALSVGPHHFQADVFFQKTASLSTERSQSGERVHICLEAKGLRASLDIHLVPDRSLRFLLLATEAKQPFADQDRDCIEDWLSGRHADGGGQLSSDNPRSIFDALQACAFHSGHPIYAAMLQIDAEAGEAEQGQDYATGTAFMAGMPPLILVEGGHFQFPIRSGIPLGVTDANVDMQTFEHPLHSSLYLHSPLVNSQHGLRDLHELLLHFDPVNLPPDIILLRLALKAIDPS